MPERLHPGVYVEEVPPTVRAIEGMSTSTAAFVGVAECGPVKEPVLVTSFKEYQNKFGGFRDDSFLSYSVLNFFENGGRKCYIVRVVGTADAKASIQLRDRERVDLKTEEGTKILYDIFPEGFAEPVLTISASSPGKWGNDIDIEIKESTNDPDNEFKIIVKRRDDVLETWDNLSMVIGDDNYVENIIGGEQSQYITVKRITEAKSSTPGILLSGILDDSAKNLTTIPHISNPDFGISLNGSSPPRIIQLETTNGTEDEIASDIQTKVRLEAPAIATEAHKRAFEKFECYVKTQGTDKRYILISGEGGTTSDVGVTSGTSPNNDACVRLKLIPSSNTESNKAFENEKALKISGLGLQLGTSKSDNEPAISISSNRTLSFSLNKDGFQSVTLDQKATGDDIADDIQAKIIAKSKERKDPSNEGAYQNFTAKYTSGYELIFGGVDSNAGEFSFTSKGSGTDLTDDSHLHLRATATGGEILYGGKPGSSLSMKAGLSARERTITSGSTKNNRPVSNISSTTNGTITLHIRPPNAAIDGSEDIDLDMMLRGGLSKGKEIADTIQEKIRGMVNDSKISSHAEIRKALEKFEAHYFAYYTLTSGQVKQDGPISSVEVLASSIETEDAAVALGLGKINRGIEQNGAAMLRPIEGEYHLGDHTKGGAVYGVTPGNDGKKPDDGNFTGDDGLKLLDKVDDVNIIAIPGRGSKKVVSSGMSYAMNRKLQDCFFIADMGGAHKDDLNVMDTSNPFINDRDDAKQFARTIPVKSDFGAIYFPWIKAPDPIGKGKNPTRYLPPSGYMAGIYARIDGKRGVFKAPAGTEANLIGTTLPPLDLAAKIDDTDQDFLNPIGVNVIRSFPASGIVAWGARTLGSDPAWRYIPVRRMAIFLRVSIYNGIQWAVFEPNDEPLWSSLRLNVGAFMYTQFRGGAFQGSTPSEAYFVKCDSSTTTQQDIDNGVVNVLVGFAPLKPAEFVVIRLSQKAGQAPK